MLSDLGDAQRERCQVEAWHAARVEQSLAPFLFLPQSIAQCGVDCTEYSIELLSSSPLLVFRRSMAFGVAGNGIAQPQPRISPGSRLSAPYILHFGSAWSLSHLAWLVREISRDLVIEKKIVPQNIFPLSLNIFLPLSQRRYGAASHRRWRFGADQKSPPLPRSSKLLPFSCFCNFL